MSFFKLALVAFFIPLSTFASITVSGISSGAYMAQQFHAAFSNDVDGVGIIAGGPYYCAKGKMIDALNRCMKTSLGVPQVLESIAAAEKEAREGRIDPVHNLTSSKVYVLGGTSDSTVEPKVVQAVIDTYKAWKVPSENMKTETSLNVGHAFPTENFGNACTVASQPPFISKCGRDIAGEMLNHLMGPLQPKALANPTRLMSFNQLDGVTFDLDRLSMYKTAYAYVPVGCENPERAGCRIHIAFHGCKQTVDDLKDTFMMKTGYNEWAESNRIVVFYPQAQKNMLVNNPNGCWDWWGYTKESYHTRSGPQMERVFSLVQKLNRGEIKFTPAFFEDQNI